MTWTCTGCAAEGEPGYLPVGWAHYRVDPSVAGVVCPTCVQSLMRTGRRGWDGWVVMLDGTVIEITGAMVGSAGTERRLQGHLRSARWTNPQWRDVRELVVSPMFGRVTVGRLEPGWTPSAEDLLADDWCEFEELT